MIYDNGIAKARNETAPEVLPVVWTIGFALSMFLVGSFFLALSPILPDVARDLGADPVQLGYPGAAYGLALGLTSIVLAPFHDILSRRTLLASGISLHLTGLVCVALSPNWSILVVGHALCGCGGGIFMPAAYAAISSRTAESRRARTLGRVNSGWAASTLVGVPAAALLGDVLGWRGMICILAVTWMVIAALIAPILKVSDRPAGSSVTSNGFWSRDVFFEMRAAGLPWLFASTVLVFVGFYGVYAYLGIAIRDDLGVEAGSAGLFVAIYGLGFLTGTLNGWIIDRVGPERSLCVATVALSAILLSIPNVTYSIVLLGLVMYLWGLFQNAAFTSFTTAISKTKEGLRGRAFSINTACVFVGSSIGTAAMGVVNASAGFIVVGIACMLATAAASLIVAWKVVTPHKLGRPAP